MFDNILNIVLYSFLVFIIVYFGFRNIKLRKNLQDEVIKRLQMSTDRNIVIQEYTNLVQELENMKLEKSDDFVKFLSDTRNAAFDYIEDVQSKIQEFDIHLQSIVEWNNTYGSVIGDIPHTEKIKEISLAYQSIRELLPENQTPNN